jgi:error-prone DNA polymerase
MEYTELQVTTNFSFLRGASHPEEMVQQAAALGYTEIAITDINSMAGIVRAYAASKKYNLRIIVGCHLQLMDAPELLVYPTNIDGYSQLCELLTVGNLRTEKGKCELYKADVFQHIKNVKLIALPPQRLNNLFELEHSFQDSLLEFKKYFAGDLYVAAQRKYNGDDSKYLFRLWQLSSELQIPLIATNDVYYHEPGRRQLQDVLTCIKEKCTIQNAGFKLYPNAERYLKTEDEMKRLFRQYPEALLRTQEIVAACTFSLDELKYEYPEEITSEGRTPQEELTYLTWKGAKDYFGEPLPAKTVNAINHELKFIEEMNYAAYFLTVYDIVRFARSKDILCQGRGSAANSTVCFCLGITSVNPEKFDLLFERFLSAARNEPPDIDVDFEHERREEVIQYIYEKYGRDRAAIVATVTQQHQKGAIRDVAKAMGLSVDTIRKISESVVRFGNEAYDDKKTAAEIGMNANDRYLKKVFELTNQFIGFPRQLGQHTGGFVISQNKLSKLCPVLNARMENRTCIEWNKDDIDVLKFLKIDVLALGMLTCIRKAFDLIKQHYGLQYELATIPQDDPAVYEMIGRADTIGVFQIESRAQQTMLPQMKPKTFYDLVIEVAIVRPGPIQGDMVHPYLNRRTGKEKVEYPSKELEEILGRTLGVPLFQEQAMKVAIVAAGFTPAEADDLRRNMATFKTKGMLHLFEKKLVDGMVKRGYKEEYAKRIHKQLEGFGSYGFPESHAASFAQLVYVSSWIKCHYPDVFAAALLNSLPMGFYQPAQIVMDAQKHQVVIKPVDINFSYWNNTLEKTDGQYFALRLGFRQITGIREDDMQLLLKARTEPFKDIFSVSSIGLSDIVFERLADADVFRSVGLNRREALWQISVKDKPTALFSGYRENDKKEQAIELPFMQPEEHVMRDYAATSLSVKAHPVSFLREKLNLLQVTINNQLIQQKNGAKVKAAGLVIVRQRPETAKGVWFVTLEDETGFSNLVIFENIQQKFKKEILQARLLMVEGMLQIEGEVVHIIVHRCFDISKMLYRMLMPYKENVSLPNFPNNDEMKNPKPPAYKEKPVEKIIPEGRNFH